jgi:hypothetical protein
LFVGGLTGHMDINIMKVAEIIYFNLETVFFFSLASYMGIENMKVAGIKTTEMWRTALKQLKGENIGCIASPTIFFLHHFNPKI